MDTEAHPLFTATTITTGAGLILALIVAFGIPISNELKFALLAVVGFATPYLVYFMTRHKVTPLAEPKATDGTPLVKATTLEKTEQQQKREARSAKEKVL